MAYEAKVTQLTPVVTSHFSNVAVGLLMCIGLVVVAIAIADYFMRLQRRKLRRLEEEYLKLLKYNHFLVEQLGPQTAVLQSNQSQFMSLQETAPKMTSINHTSRPLGSLKGSGLARYEKLDSSYPSQFSQNDKTVVANLSEVTLSTTLSAKRGVLVRRNKDAAFQKEESVHLMHSNVA